MKKFKTLALSTVALVGLGMSGAYAQNDADFTAHHLIEEKDYKEHVQDMSAEDKLVIHEYLNYEQREPCQFYQPIPQGFMKDGCDIVKKTLAPLVKTQPVVVKRVIERDVLADYDINFGFDSAFIEPAANDVLDRVAREIKTHNPREVTVAGHADRSGPSEYNITLSQKRAMAVSDALTSRGVTNRILDQEAYGESAPVVDTADGVRNAENRRVEIQFLK